MATDTWTGVFGGNWSDPTGWSGGTVPAAGDTVQLSQALNGPYTVHLDANEGAYAALTVSAANATLALYDGGLTLSVTGATTRCLPATSRSPVTRRSTPAPTPRAAAFSACRTAPSPSPGRRRSRAAGSPSTAAASASPAAM